MFSPNALRSLPGVCPFAPLIRPPAFHRTSCRFFFPSSLLEGPPLLHSFLSTFSLRFLPPFLAFSLETHCFFPSSHTPGFLRASTPWFCLLYPGCRRLVYTPPDSSVLTGPANPPSPVLLGRVRPHLSTICIDFHRLFSSLTPHCPPVFHPTFSSPLPFPTGDPPPPPHFAFLVFLTLYSLPRRHHAHVFPFPVSVFSRVPSSPCPSKIDWICPKAFHDTPPSSPCRPQVQDLCLFTTIALFGKARRRFAVWPCSPRCDDVSPPLYPLK